MPNFARLSVRHSLLARLLASNLALAAVTVLSLTSLFLWAYTRDLDRQVARRADSLAGFQQISRARHIRFLIDPPHLAPKLKRRAQVNDRAAAPHCRHDAGAIAQVPAGNPDPVAK